MLGIYLREGIGCVANEKEYLMWLEKAAKQGLLQAQEELGYFYSHKEPDFSRAYHWFVRAAAQGSAPALYDFGVLLDSRQFREGGLHCRCGIFRKIGRTWALASNGRALAHV